MLSPDSISLTGAESYVEAYDPQHVLAFDSGERIDEQFERAMLGVHLPREGRASGSSFGGRGIFFCGKVRRP